MLATSNEDDETYKKKRTKTMISYWRETYIKHALPNTYTTVSNLVF